MQKFEILYQTPGCLKMDPERWLTFITYADNSEAAKQKFLVRLKEMNESAINWRFENVHDLKVRFKSFEVTPQMQPIQGTEQSVLIPSLKMACDLSDPDHVLNDVLDYLQKRFGNLRHGITVEYIENNNGKTTDERQIFQQTDSVEFE